MSSILKFRIPLKENVTADDIRQLVCQWISESPYYCFDDTVLSSKEACGFRTSYIDDNDSKLQVCESTDYSIQTYYLAYRIDTKNFFNLLWRADVVYESTCNNEKHLIVHMNRSVIDDSFPSDLSEKVKYPSIINHLIKAKLYKEEPYADLKNQKPLHSLTHEEREAIRHLFSFRGKTAFPFMYVYADEKFYDQGQCLNQDQAKNDESASCSRRNDYKWDISQGSYQTLLDMFSTVCHLYTARCPEENELWNSLTHGRHHYFEDQTPTSLSCHRIEISMPGYGQMNYIPLTDSLDPDQLYRFLIMMLQTCMQRYPENLPDFDTIEQLQAKEKSSEKSMSYYINLTPEISDRLLRARKDANLTQEDVAEKLNVGKMFISRLERNQTLRVKREFLTELMHVLGIKEDTLY